MDAGTLSLPQAEQAEAEESVPFQPQNRMTTFLVVAVLIVCGMSVWGVRVIANSPNPTSTPGYAFLGISIALALKILLSMLQTEFARREFHADLRNTRHSIRNDLQANSLKMDEVVRKTNGGLTHAVNAVGEQVRLAERDQVLHDAAFRAEIARELCPMLADDVARRVVEMMRNPPQPQGDAI